MKWKKFKKLRKRAAVMMLAFSLFGGMLPNSMNIVEAAGTDDNLRGPIMREEGSVRQGKNNGRYGFHGKKR